VGLPDLCGHCKLSLLYYWLLELLFFQFSLLGILQQNLTSCKVSKSTHLWFWLIVFQLLHFLPVHLCEGIIHLFSNDIGLSNVLRTFSLVFEIYLDFVLIFAAIKSIGD